MIQENIDITNKHTFGITTRTAAWGEYETIDRLRELITTARQRNMDFMPIGQGSNLLFVRDYNGMLLHSVMKELDVEPVGDDELLVTAGSGWVWDDFVSRCVSEGWAGVENLSYIPGTVGASAVQNVGAYGVEVCDVIECATVLDVETLETKTIARDECAYGYRTSLFKTDWRGKYIVTSVTYRLKRTPEFRLGYGNLREAVGDNPTLQSVRQAVIAVRRSKLPEPSELGSAGSFFVNPVISREHYNKLREQYNDMPCYEVDAEKVKVPAGWLIDRLGWKGKSIGGAKVYERQCLVIVNTGSAKAGHVVQLAQDIAFSVLENYGIIITPEVNYV